MSDYIIPENIPSAADILHFVERAKKSIKKTDIAKHFGIKGNDRIGLKHRLKQMVEQGDLIQGSHRSFSIPERLPPVITALVESVDQDDVAMAKPLSLDHLDARAKETPITVLPAETLKHDVKAQDRVLLRVHKNEDGAYEGLIIRRMPAESYKKQNGFIRFKGKRVVFYPTGRENKQPITVTPEADVQIKDGDFVSVVWPDQDSKPQIEEVLGHEDDVNIVSLIAIHNHGIPQIFPEDVVLEAEASENVDLGEREDLRDTPLITIDGADARDFDDAVWAKADNNEHNAVGFKIIVAIADVAHYVKPNSALDREALRRGNSSYFPDRVVPMLPEKLSNGLCSLVPNEDRACMAVKMTINGSGQLVRHRVVRGLMRSHARLTYQEAQKALDGEPTQNAQPVLQSTLKPLYRAYKALLRAREERGTVDFDFPERKVEIKDGRVVDVYEGERLDAHKLIEEMMILANVAVAKALEKVKHPLIYRTHGRPDGSKLQSTKTVLKELGFDLGEIKYGIHPKDLGSVLSSAQGQSQEHLVQTLILRTLAQAEYSSKNIGHFGLALESYAHYTSPIRRYSDLIVHRALVRAFDLPGYETDGLTDDAVRELENMSKHISETERRSMLAEREAMDRYLTIYMQGKMSEEFQGRISGVNKFGLFVRIDVIGAEGLVPIRTLHDDYYIYDETRHVLIGRRHRKTYRLGAEVRVKLVECNVLTGQMRFSILSAKTFKTKKMDKRLSDPKKKRSSSQSKHPKKSGARRRKKR